ncbi:MAG TPA: hypothetical protein PK390_06225 [Fervidobacterium nodosum]|nr:hypothetical protein [Fervidobacterium nodosum]
MGDPRWLETIVIPNIWIAEARKPKIVATGRWLVAYETFIKIPNEQLDSIYIYDLFTEYGIEKASIKESPELRKDVFKATYEYWDNGRKYDVDVAGVFKMSNDWWPPSACVFLLARLIQKIDFEPVTMGVRFEAYTSFEHNRVGTYTVWAASNVKGILFKKKLPKLVQRTERGGSVVLNLAGLKMIPVKAIRLVDGLGLVSKDKLFVPTEYKLVENELLCAEDVKTIVKE